MSTRGPYFRSAGGKIAYNTLYADGHVLTNVDRGDAYRGMWLMFPYQGPHARANLYPD